MAHWWLVALVPSCTVFTPLDGYTGGEEPDLAIGSARDAEADTPSDAGVEAAVDPSPLDAATDAMDAADAHVDPDMIGWWKLDETSGTAAADSSGRMNNGSLLNGVGWSIGVRGGAAQFDGDGARIFVEDAPSLQTMTDALTVALWVWIDERPPTYSERLVELGAAWNIKVNNTHPQFTASSSDPRYAAMTDTLPVKEWHHLAFSFDQGTVKGYYDGAPTTFHTQTFTTSDPLLTSLNGFTIGSSDTAVSSCMCRLDDVRIYRRALTADEVEALVK